MKLNKPRRYYLANKELQYFSDIVDKLYITHHTRSLMDYYSFRCPDTHKFIFFYYPIGFHNAYHIQFHIFSGNFNQPLYDPTIITDQQYLEMVTTKLNIQPDHINTRTAHL